MRPSQPSSASLPQNSSVVPVGSSIIRRTKPDGHSFSRKLRAVWRRSSCSWLNPKSIRPLGPQPEGRRTIGPAVGGDVEVSRWSILRQTEDALGQDVPLDLSGAALDRVGPRPEERVVPVAAVDRPGRALRELPVGAEELLGEVLERLVPVAPPDLPGGGLGARHLAPEELRD